MARVNFFAKESDFKLSHPLKTIRWITAVAKKEKVRLVNLDYVFCSDKFLLQINQEFLKHDTYTDIITFNYSTEKREVEGEVYISIPRVRENAPKFSSSFEMELDRVIIHGLLHLIGYNDKTPVQISKMREKEEAYLSLR